MLQSNANVSSVRTVNSRTATASTVNGPHKNTIVELQMKTWDGSMWKEISSCGRDRSMC
mgnify:FL=1